MYVCFFLQCSQEHVQTAIVSGGHKNCEELTRKIINESGPGYVPEVSVPDTSSWQVIVFTIVYLDILKCPLAKGSEISMSE